MLLPKLFIWVSKSFYKKNLLLEYDKNTLTVYELKKKKNLLLEYDKNTLTVYIWDRYLAWGWGERVQTVGQYIYYFLVCFLKKYMKKYVELHDVSTSYKIKLSIYNIW